MILSFSPLENVDCISGLIALAAIFFAYVDSANAKVVSWKTIVKEMFFVSWGTWSCYVLVHVNMPISSLGMFMFSFGSLCQLFKHSVYNLLDWMYEK